jgi:ribosomal-protein-alanine N-acetyltransferase
MTRSVPLETKETILFERGIAADLPAVIALERKCFTCPWTEKMFYSEYFDNPFSSCWVARHEECVVGYLIFWEVGGEFHLMNMALDSAWRKKGIGTDWLRWLIQRGRKKGITQITLEVRASNLPARRLYQKMGFQEVGMRKRYYTAPIEDALLLTYTFR